MSLVDDIKYIQRATGATADGVFGPETANAVIRELGRATSFEHPRWTGVDMDPRTVNHLQTLDPKAREAFGQFYRLANATAATFGCSYILIGGNRTWEEQDALYAIGRTTDGSRVTNAKGGQSNHNFGIAGDFGVFRGKTYLDDSNPPLASKVHRACSIHAAACGLAWGGSWNHLKDEPHYEVSTDLGMMEKRELYKQKGSVL